MLSGLERKRKILEIQRLETARMEMEFKIEERLEEIERLKANVDNQTKAVAKIKAELELGE